MPIDWACSDFGYRCALLVSSTIETMLSLSLIICIFSHINKHLGILIETPYKNRQNSHSKNANLSAQVTIKRYGRGTQQAVQELLAWRTKVARHQVDRVTKWCAACACENKQNVAARWHCPRLACKHVAHGMFMLEWIASVNAMQCSGCATISTLRWLAPSASTLLADLRAVRKVTRHSCFFGMS
jgi:hypothetical protein